MRLPTIPLPPNPDDARYRTSPLAWQRDVYAWMGKVKNEVEHTGRTNFAPMQQAFTVGTFSTNTTLTGTSTLGDVANYVCSLVTALTTQGLVKSV